MKTYKANKKGLISYLILISIALPIVIFLLNKNVFTEKPYILLPLISPIILLLWVYFDTSYKIDNMILYYRSGFLRGQININDITEIHKGKTMWNGVKPALAKNGLTINYNSVVQMIIHF